MARLSKAQREELLGKLRNGHDVEAASAALEITENQIKASGSKLAADIAAAYRTGTARLRARLLELSLTNEDASALARLVDRREQQVASAGETGIVEVRRVIISAVCESCGHRPAVDALEPSQSSPGNGSSPVKLSDRREDVSA